MVCNKDWFLKYFFASRRGVQYGLSSIVETELVPFLRRNLINVRRNKLSLLSSKLMNKMGRTHIFLDGLPNLARYLFCYENHSNGHFSKMGCLYANESTVLVPNVMKQCFGLIRFTLAFFSILFYQIKPRVDFGGIFTLD